MRACVVRLFETMPPLHNPVINRHMYAEQDTADTVDCWRDAYDIVGGELQNQFLLTGVYVSHFNCVELCKWEWD